MLYDDSASFQRKSLIQGITKEVGNVPHVEQQKILFYIFYIKVVKSIYYRS